MDRSMEWEDLLHNTPVFVINLDRRPDRYNQTITRIRAAGFQNITRYQAVDAACPQELADAWAAHGNPMLDDTDLDFVINNGQQGCLLSHLGVWQLMMTHNIQQAVIFEDDVMFHSEWHELAPKYFQMTPCEFDVLFMGTQLDFGVDTEVARVPTYCLHAYVLTLHGAKLLYERVTRCPRGVRTIDCMLIEDMRGHVYRGDQLPFRWWVWNGLKHAEPGMLKHRHWGKRNMGLVYQDVELGTDVKPRP